MNNAGITLLLIILSAMANATQRPTPVFVHAACNQKISSSVLSSLRDEIRGSQKYELIPTLDDNGRMDEVLTIQMSCRERIDVAAVATAYGKGKCLSYTNCHGAFDVSSLRADFCDSSNPAACGKALYRAFDEYMSHPNSIPLSLE